MFHVTMSCLSLFNIETMISELEKGRYIMDYSKLKYIRLFKDEYPEEEWKTICEVLGVDDNDKLISVELGVVKVTTQIH